MQQPAEIKLVPFHLARDLPLLERWLARPHVLRWWDDPETNLAEARHLPPGAGHALIAADTLPVGYLRWERVSPRDLADVGLDDIPEGAVDIDIFIDEPAYIGRDVGPCAL